MAMRTRLAALGVEANHEEVARRLDAWDAQIAISRRKHQALASLLAELEQEKLPLGAMLEWPRTHWASAEESK